MAAELKKLEEKYAGRPVVFIGIHSAKFKNEADPKNIENAIMRYDISHPVVVDNNMMLWKSYGASGWPTIFIIDPNGKIVFKHSGEGQIDRICSIIDEIIEKHSSDGSLKRFDAPVAYKRSRPTSLLYYPSKIAFSPSLKYMAISDSGNNRIIIAERGTFRVVRIAGNMQAGNIDGQFELAAFNSPQGVAWASEDKLYVADSANHTIRELSLLDGTVKTLAGTGKEQEWPTLGGIGKDAALNSPWDIVYSKGRIYIAMAGSHQIWELNPNTNSVHPIAGNGIEGISNGKGEKVEFAQPSGISESMEHLYVADSESSSIRDINMADMSVATIVGNGLFNFGYLDGDISSAKFQHPLGICAEINKIYVADTYNHAIRKIDLLSGIVSTIIAKKSEQSFCDYSSNECDTLELYEPSDVKYAEDKLYIADTNNHLIRVYDMTKNILKTIEFTFDNAR